MNLEKIRWKDRSRLPLKIGQWGLEKYGDVLKCDKGPLSFTKWVESRRLFVSVLRACESISARRNGPRKTLSFLELAWQDKARGKLEKISLSPARDI